MFYSYSLSVCVFFIFFMAKVPYMLVVGQKEEEEGVVSVRSRYLGDEGKKSLDSFIDRI